MERNEALRHVYTSIAHRVSLSFDQYVVAVRAWEVIPVRERGHIIGAVLRLGSELHIGVSRRLQCSHIDLIHSVLNETVNRCGEATTKVASGNWRGLEFCHRLGFQFTHLDSGLIHLRCKGYRYV